MCVINGSTFEAAVPLDTGTALQIKCRLQRPTSYVRLQSLLCGGSCVTLTCQSYDRDGAMIVHVETEDTDIDLVLLEEGWML